MACSEVAVAGNLNGHRHVENAHRKQFYQIIGSGRMEMRQGFFAPIVSDGSLGH
jgi:hypothetical protein